MDAQRSIIQSESLKDAVALAHVQLADLLRSPGHSDSLESQRSECYLLWTQKRRFSLGNCHVHKYLEAVQVVVHETRGSTKATHVQRSHWHRPLHHRSRLKSTCSSQGS